MVNEELTQIAHECSENHLAHVIDIAVHGRGKIHVEIFVDSESGITNDLCSAISRDITAALEKSDVINGSYELVVSSPGIDRPLKFSWQYKKHVGRKLVLKIKDESTVREQTARLLSVAEDGLMLEIEKEASLVRFENIIEARVKAPW